MKYLLAFALFAVASAAVLPEPVQLAEPQAPVVSASELEQLLVPQEVMDEVALLVKFVDTAENVDTPVDTSDYTVNFVDEAVNADVPIQIRLMDPLPDSVVMPFFEVPQPDASDDLAVKVVDVADVDEETPVYMPMARAAVVPSIEAVKIVDSPQEASDDFKVNFVDVAEETASYVPLSLPSDIEAENVVAALEASDDFKVNFVDVAEETASYVPLSLPSDIEAVKNVDSLPEMNDFAVKVVDVAEEHFSKQYPDPRWR